MTRKSDGESIRDSGGPGWRLRIAVIGALAVALATVVILRSGDRAGADSSAPAATTAVAADARDPGADGAPAADAAPREIGEEGPKAAAGVRAPRETGEERPTAATGTLTPRDSATAGLPRLVDLGADKCVPCKMMAPILTQLRSDFAGRFDVQFIDVWKHREKAQEYGIRVIPTQIFYDAGGNELFRHEGYFSREDILRTWREHGFDFAAEDTAQDAS